MFIGKYKPIGWRSSGRTVGEITMAQMPKNIRDAVRRVKRRMRRCVKTVTNTSGRNWINKSAKASELHAARSLRSVLQCTLRSNNDDGQANDGGQVNER